MDHTLPDKTVSAETPPPALFWLATRVFLAHILLSILGSVWAFFVGQPFLALLFAVLWLLATILWIEWKNSE